MALSLLAPLRCPSCGKLHIDEGPWARHGHTVHHCMTDSAGTGCGRVFETADKRIGCWTPDDLLRRVNELTERRTPGPWRLSRSRPGEVWVPGPSGMMGWAGERRLCALASHPGAADDASFIAAAPTLIDALAAIVERNAKAERGLWRRLVAWVFRSPAERHGR